MPKAPVTDRVVPWFCYMFLLPVKKTLKIKAAHSDMPWREAPKASLLMECEAVSLEVVRNSCKAIDGSSERGVKATFNKSRLAEAFCVTSIQCAASEWKIFALNMQSSFRVLT